MISTFGISSKTWVKQKQIKKRVRSVNVLKIVGKLTNKMLFAS